MKYIKSILFLLLSFSGSSQVVIASLEDLYQLADSAAFDLRISNLELGLSEITEKAARGNILNPRIPVNASLTNNTELPVSFIPGEAFGGAPGSLRQITLGQQYISSMSINPQIDLFNPSRWHDLKTARLGKEISSADLEVQRMQLRNELAAFFLGVLKLKEQQRITEISVTKSDSIHAILDSKFKLGLVRQSDLNLSRMNLLRQNQLLFEIDSYISSQLNQIEQFFGKEITLSANLRDCLVDEGFSRGSITTKLFQVKKLYQESILKTSRWDQLPSVALVSSFAWQNNSNSKLIDNSQPWIYSNYVGVRMTWDLPTNVGKLAIVGQNKVKSKIASIELERELWASKKRQEVMKTDIVRFKSDYLMKREISELEQQNFNSSLDLFSKDLLSPDKLLEQQLKVLQAQLDEINAFGDLCIQIRKFNNGY